MNTESRPLLSFEGFTGPFFVFCKVEPYLTTIQILDAIIHYVKINNERHVHIIKNISLI